MEESQRDTDWRLDTNEKVYMGGVRNVNREEVTLLKERYPTRGWDFHLEQMWMVRGVKSVPESYVISVLF